MFPGKPKFLLVAALSNFEVYQFVKEERISTRQDDVDVPSPFATVLYQLAKYLGQIGTSNQKEESLRTVILKLHSYKLSKSEVLQIINSNPKVPVELYLIVDNCEDRFEEEHVKDILHLLKENV
uniref:DNA-directed RNA polymerase III subunit RPC9 n=1 Tax=Trichuris muris TaxID=70415 RepID=A0A5S6QR94_TRIMR